MDSGLRSKLEALGTEITPELLQGTTGLYAELHASRPPGAATIHRDETYGPDERHRVDVFEPPEPASRPRPVLVFVHGGGFVMGDKSQPDSPFYDNVGQWAAARGWIGVTMTYRLAPAHPWPCGAEDVGRAVEWLSSHVERFDGDPARIFLMGQSAGAVHAATYIAFPEFHGAAGRALAGGLLISGIYDMAEAEVNDFNRAYFGDDARRYAERSSLEGLVASDLPILLSVSEIDGIDFQRQAARYVETYLEARDRYPHMIYLTGHNHLSSVQQIGLSDDTLGPEIERFVAAVAAHGAID